MSTDFSIQLMQLQDATQRMAALCRFIEFWLGPRRQEYGVPEATIANTRIPAPLKSLYAFAGQWAARNDAVEGEFMDHPFSQQDHLRTLDLLQTAENGKLIFLDENQGCWNCRTLCEGDDPPVWCFGDHEDDDGNFFRGEAKSCESLSEFLVSFVLQELMFGSQLCLGDDHLESLFEQSSESVTDLWLHGPYVFGGKDHNFYLWHDVLVGCIHGSYWFAANSIPAIGFLTENQGPIISLTLLFGMSWSLDVENDGAGTIRYSGQSVEIAKFPSDTFDFSICLGQLLHLASDDGHFNNNPMVAFERKGQSSTRAKHLHDWPTVRGMFQHAMHYATDVSPTLRQAFVRQWEKEPIN